MKKLGLRVANKYVGLWLCFLVFALVAFLLTSFVALSMTWLFDAGSHAWVYRMYFLGTAWFLVNKVSMVPLARLLHDGI